MDSIISSGYLLHLVLLTGSKYFKDKKILPIIKTIRFEHKYDEIIFRGMYSFLKNTFTYIKECGIWLNWPFYTVFGTALDRVGTIFLSYSSLNIKTVFFVEFYLDCVTIIF